MEDKQKICDLLVPVLQETRDFQELDSLIYLIKLLTNLVPTAQGKPR